MNYHHLSIEERSCIRKYYVDGLSCGWPELPRDRTAGRKEREYDLTGDTTKLYTHV